MTDPAEIARGLTKAQRLAVTFTRNRWKYAGTGNGPTYFKLWQLGIVERQLDTYKSVLFRLTPLGEAVKQHIEEADDAS